MKTLLYRIKDLGCGEFRYRVEQRRRFLSITLCWTTLGTYRYLDDAKSVIEQDIHLRINQCKASIVFERMEQGVSL